MVNSGLCCVDTPSLRKFRLISYTRSKPPTVRRLRYSSGAMRRYMSTSSALWCVLKGRAAGDRMQHRRFDFEKTARVQKGAQVAHDGGAHFEHAAAVFIHDQIDIAA